MTHICSVQSQQVYSETPKESTQRPRTPAHVRTVLTGALTHPKSSQEYSLRQDRHDRPEAREPGEEECLHPLSSPTPILPGTLKRVIPLFYRLESKA